MDFLKKELKDSIQLSQAAGLMAQEMRKTKMNMKMKSNSEGPVTDADLAVNDFLVSQIQRLYPDDLVVSEESIIPEDLIQDKRVWFIDPIDGTIDFMNSGFEWACMIGMAINGRSVLGVVHQPDMAKLYYAIEGHGAYLKIKNEMIQLKVNRIESPADAILIQSRHHYDKKIDNLAKKIGIKKMLLQSSMGLKVSSIAEGKADIYFNLSKQCHLWDLCASEIILREAGGKIAHENGEPLSYSFIGAKIESPFVACANGLINVLTPYLK